MYNKPKRDAWEQEQRDLLPVRLALTERKFYRGGIVHRLLDQYRGQTDTPIRFDDLRGNVFHAADIQQCLMWGFIVPWHYYAITATGIQALELLGPYDSDLYHKDEWHPRNRKYIICPVQPSQQWLEYFTTHRW